MSSMTSAGGPTTADASSQVDAANGAAATTDPSSTATADATTGATTLAGGPLTPDVQTAIQQVIAAIGSLTALLGGSAAAPAPGAAPVPPTTDPSVLAGGAAAPVQTPMQSPMQMPMGADAGVKAHGAHSMPGMDMGGPKQAANPANAARKPAHKNPNPLSGKMHMKGMGEMFMVPRTAPEDRARAQANLDAVQEFFKDHGRAGLNFGHTKTHGVLSAKDRAAYKAFLKKRGTPDLAVPSALVVPQGANKPMGAVYRTNQGAFDLGMGTRHQHHEGADEMQHLWFTNKLDLAYSDVKFGMGARIHKKIEQAAHKH
jgi:hypothetical protein